MGIGEKAIIDRKIKEKETIGERIFALRKGLKLSQKDIAIAIDVSHVSVSQWESSDSHPNGSNLMALGVALHCTPDYLMYGIECDKTALPSHSRRYPVLSSIQAGKWRESLSKDALKRIDTWMESDAQLSGDGFWLHITNNAMASLSGLSVPENSYVLFDTKRKAVIGDLVLIKLKGKDNPIFRQLILDGDLKYLKPLNPSWPISAYDNNHELLCVGIETRIHLAQ